MPKAEWGVKRTCAGCGVRFYDLTREPIICPKCGAELDISVPMKPKRSKPAPVKAAAKAAVKDEELIDDADVDADIPVDDADDIDDDDVDVTLEDDDDDTPVVAVKGAKGDDEDAAVDVIDPDGLLDDETDGDDDLDDDDDAADGKTKK